MQAAARLRVMVRIATTSTRNTTTAYAFGAWAALVSALHYFITAVAVRTQSVTCEELSFTIYNSHGTYGCDCSGLDTSSPPCAMKLA